MSDYAIIKNNIVENIIVCEDSDSYILDTFYPDAESIIKVTDINGPAFIGGILYKNRFRSPSPHPSWIFNESEWSWNPPTPYPEDEQTYIWVEETLNWQLIENNI